MMDARAAWRVAALILAVGCLFGATFVLIKFALTSITPFSIGLLRLVTAALSLLVVLRWRGLRLPAFGRIWGSFTVMGLGNGALAYVLINWSAQYLEAGMVGILIATTPIFTAVLAHLFTTDERLRFSIMAGISLGFAGVVLLLGPEALLAMRLEGRRPLGVLAMLGAALCYAVAAVHGKRLQHVPPLITATAQQLTGAAAMLPVVLIFESPFSLSPRWQDLAAVAAGGVFGTGLAYMLFFRVLALAGATRTTLITYVTPMAAILLGALFLGERLPLRAFVAMGLILLGMTVVGARSRVRE
jgi:drug/metabolite transporter (DMT)-like permease